MMRALPPHPVLLACGVFLLFVGVRMHFIMLFASQTPYWDDWGMGNRMALYLESGFDATWLYGLTNEHRAMFSKLTNLALFILNDHQWDPFITMVLDAFLWGAIGVFVLYIGFRERNTINPWLFATLIVVLWTYPLSLFNTLSTIQTYLYYMIFFVIAGFWLITAPIFSFRWWCGVLCIAAACMTAGGGSFAPVAVVAVSGFLALFSAQKRSHHIVTAAFALIFAIFGLYLILSQGSSNPWGPKSLSPFLTTLFKTLSWPSSDRAWPSVILLSPIVLLAIGVAARKIPPSRLTTFTLMMAAFGIMLSVAIAYARGGTGRGPAERYFDFLTIYLIASALSLMLINRSVPASAALLSRGLAVVWVSVCLLAVPYHLKVSRFQLADRARLVPVQEDIMARYSVNDDPSVFENREFRQVPFPRVSTLQDFMARLKRTDTLPYSLQASSAQLIKSTSLEDSEAFVIDGIPQPEAHRYRGLENVIGSFHQELGGNNAVGEYMSEVIAAERPYVMLPVSGDLGQKSLTLALVGETNGNVTTVTPGEVTGASDNLWHEILIPAPDSAYRIVAVDESATAWFAFAAPRTVGPVSYLVDRIMRVGDKIWLIGLLLISIALGHAYFRRYRSTIQ